LAQDFIAVAIELDPGNPRLKKLREFIQENADLQESVKEINEFKEIHEVIKHVVSSCYQVYLRVFEKEEAEDKLDEMYELLENALTVDPHNKEIKESARTIKEEYPEVYGLNDDVFESILSAPVAALRVDDCPHCGDPVQFEKGSSGRGTCSGCSGDIRISGTEVRPVSTATQTSTGRSGTATVGSRGSTTDTTEKSSRSGKSEKSLEEASSGGVFSSKLFWLAVVVGFLIPPHIYGVAILIGGAILDSFLE
jgi:hypothetical protein